MAGPHQAGCRNLWWFVILLSASALAAPQLDRRTLQFGGQRDPAASGRTLFANEPTIITEPLPGQEFVFISASPSQSRTPLSPAAGGRAGRFESSSSLPSWAERPGVRSARIITGSVPTFLTEDGILVASPQSDPEEAESKPEVSAVEEPAPEVLAVNEEPQERRPEAEASVDQPVEESVAPEEQQKSPTDSVAEDPSSVVILSDGHNDEAHRQDKAIDTKDSDDFNIIPAETVSRRTVIKTAANGQDYEYEYLYYDEEDAANGAVQEEPSLLVPDQTIEATLRGSPEERSSSDVVTHSPTGETSTVNLDGLIDLIVNEPKQVSKVAFTVGSEEQTTPPMDAAVPVQETRAEEEDVAPVTSDRRQPARPIEESETDGKTSGSSKTGRPSRINTLNSGVADSELENRQGLAEDRTRLFIDFNFDDFFGHSGQKQEEPTESPRTATRFPPRFQHIEEDSFFDERPQAPLRTVDSSSFRNPAGVPPPSNEQHTVGRLTVISGPARLPVLTQFDSVERDEPEIAEPGPVVSSQVVHEESGRDIHTPHIIQAQAFDESQPFFHESNDEPKEPVFIEDAPISGEVQGSVQEERAPTTTPEPTESVNLSPSQPQLFDLLAFSRAVEQEQQDEQQTKVPDIEDVVVVNEHTSPTAALEVAPQEPVELPHSETETNTEVPLFTEKEVQIQHADIVPVAEVTTVAAPEPVFEVVHEPAVIVSEPESTPFQPAVTPDVVVLEESESPSPAVVAAVDLPVAEEEEIVTTEIPTTTPTTTTTTETTTTTTTTTTEATKTRGPSRFSGSSGNSNRFANRIRSKAREGITSSTTTTTTAAPVTRKTGFTRGGALNNRLRRPTVTEAPVVAVAEETEDESSSAKPDTQSTTSTTTRRPLTPNIRNRFNLRRNQGEDQTGQSVATDRSTSAPARLRTTTASRVVVSPRPMSPLHKRGRLGATTTTTVSSTTTEETLATVVDGEEDSTAKSEVDDEDQASKTTTTTTSTTTKPTGLNRLRNRVSLAVSERPKPVRSQVSLSDRRNRISALKKPTGEAEDVAENKEVTVKTVPNSSGQSNGSVQSSVAEPARTDSEPAGSANAAAPAPVNSPIPLRSLRQNRRPGQLASRPAFSN